MFPPPLPLPPLLRTMLRLVEPSLVPRVASLAALAWCAGTAGAALCKQEEGKREEGEG